MSTIPMTTADYGTFLGLQTTAQAMAAHVPAEAHLFSVTDSVHDFGTDGLRVACPMLDEGDG